MRAIGGRAGTGTIHEARDTTAAPDPRIAIIQRLVELRIARHAAYALLKPESPLLHHRLSPDSGIAIAEDVLQPQLHRIHVQAAGKLVHLALHREVRLRAAKATERASIRMIGEHRP